MRKIVLEFTVIVSWALSALGSPQAQGGAFVFGDSTAATASEDGSPSALVRQPDPSRSRQLLLADDDDDDRNITLRGGVLLAPPFAIYDDEKSIYTGFQGDLLRRLQIFAAEDGYDLRFELELSPPQYGAALDWVANDCNTSANPNSLEDCQRFDLIVGDYYCNGPRSIRVDFSPTWLRTTMSTVKTIKDPDDKLAQAKDYTTLTQLQGAGGTACVPEGAYLSEVVMGKFPKANYIECPNPDECIGMLKAGDCSLYADDELALRYRALSDFSLEVTGEQFNTQYIVWPIRYSLEERKTLLLKKWMYDSVSNATLDDLSYDYFQLKLCPLGLSGENCDENCDPKHGTSDRYGRCICQSTKWTGKDCSVEVEEDLNLYPTWEVVLCYAFFGINALSCACCAIWMYWNRANNKVKVSQPFFLNLILLGCVISSASIVPIVQQSDGAGPVPACFVFPWLFCVGFSVTFGTLFAKIQRVYKLFKASANATRIVVTKTETLVVIGVITSVDLVICAVWQGIDPLRWTRVVLAADQFGDTLKSAGYCTSDHWKAFVSTIASWHLILLLGGVHLCYQSRHISKKFVESKYLLWAMVSHLQIYLISLPVLILVGTDPSTSLFIRAGVIWINDFAIIFVVFGGLMYSVHMGQSSEVDISRAINTFATRQASVGEPGTSTSRARRVGNRGPASQSLSSSISQIRLRASMHPTSSYGGPSQVDSDDESEKTSASETDSPLETLDEVTESLDELASLEGESLEAPSSIQTSHLSRTGPSSATF